MQVSVVWWRHQSYTAELLIRRDEVCLSITERILYENIAFVLRIKVFGVFSDGVRKTPRALCLAYRNSSGTRQFLKGGLSGEGVLKAVLGRFGVPRRCRSRSPAGASGAAKASMRAEMAALEAEVAGLGHR